MTQFIAIDPRVEVNGETVLSIVDGMGAFLSLSSKYLAQNGIIDPQHGQWYSQQDWLNAFKAIAANLGQDVLKQIGKKIPENAQWPSEIQTIKDGLSSIDVAYHINHRIEGKLLFDAETGQMTGGIGNYLFQDRGERCVWVICDNPYPCDFDFGIIESVAKKFRLPGTFPLVEHGEETCRKNEGSKCVYIVTW